MKSFITVLVAFVVGAVSGTYASDHYFHHSQIAILGAGLPITLMVAAAIVVISRGRKDRVSIAAQEA